MTAAERVALLSSLLALREVAARLAWLHLAAERPAQPTPGAPERGGLARLSARLFGRDSNEPNAAGREAATQERFHDAVDAHLRPLLATLPLVRDLLDPLIRIDLAEERAVLRQRIGDADYECWEGAWSDILGMPLTSWVCRATTPEPAQGRPVSTHPLLRSVRLPVTSDAPEAARLVPEPLNLRQCWRDATEAARALPPVEVVGWRVWLDALDSVLERALPRVPVFANEASPLDTLVDAARLGAALAACRVLTAAAAPTTTDPTHVRLVSIEFTPIQDFVFAVQPQSPWRTDAALGGRSSFVRLTVDLGSLAVLNRLGLPSCCQLNSAASKALLLVPDTERARLDLRKLAGTFDAWALRHLAGTGGLCVAHVRVNCQSLSVQRARSAVEPMLPLERLARRAAVAKLNRFGLAGNVSPLLSRLWDDLQQCRAFCSLDGVTPGDPRNAEGLDALRAGTSHDAVALSPSARMQLSLGRDLGVAEVLVVQRRSSQPALEPDGPREWRFADLTLSLVSRPVDPGPAALAAWDIAYATRPPKDRRFQGLAIRPIALPQGRWQGGAIAMLKGDLDRLGQVFQAGLDGATLARSIRLSREVDDFFSIDVPVLMQQSFPTVQTVLCGGDDFVFVGPAEIMPTLATRLYQEFERHCANPSLSFSAGLCVADPGAPLSDLAEAAEAALDEAKRERASICAHGVSVRWSEWLTLNELERRIGSQLGGDADHKVEFLERACAVVDARGETRHFLGQRTRERLRSTISAYVEGTPSINGEEVDKDAQRRHFWQLVTLLETDGVERHAAATRIPLQNLRLAYQANQARPRGHRGEAV